MTIEPPRMLGTNALPPVRQSPVLAAAMTGVVLVSLDVSIVNVAVHALQQAFHAGIDDLQWIVSAYTLAYAVFLLSAGALSDRFGPKAVFIAGSVVFSLSSTACGIAPSLTVLIGARVVQGMGAALLVPSSMAVLQLAYPEPKKRAAAIGWWAGAGSLALAAGPLIGGALIGAFGWRTIFLINVPVGIVGFALTVRHAPSSTPARSRALDIPGQLAAALMLICLVFTLIETGSTRLGLVGTGIGLALSLLLLIALVTIEARASGPMLPLTMFASRAFSTSVAVGFVVNFVFYGLIFVFSLFFQTVQHLSAFATGLAFVPLTATIMVVNVLAGGMIGRLGVRTVMLTGLAVSVLGYLSMISIGATSHGLLVLVCFVMAGAGIALVVPSLMTVALDAAPAGQAGIAAGILNAARQVGGATGVAIFGSIVSLSGPSRFVHAMHLSIGLSAGALLIALNAALMLIPPVRPTRTRG